MQVAKRLYRSQGIPAFFRGVSPTAVKVSRSFFLLPLRGLKLLFPTGISLERSRIHGLRDHPAVTPRVSRVNTHPSPSILRLSREGHGEPGTASN
jgi:hypothetical protein